MLQRLQYFHKLWKDNLVLDSQYWVISRDPLLAMYYSRVFKPHSGPGRKCSLPVSVTGYQPLIYYSTCWSKATQSNSLWCCLDRREERGTTEAARRPPMFCLFPKRRTEGITARLSGFWKSPEEDNYSCWIHANYTQATVAFKMSISWSLTSSRWNCLVIGDWSHAEILEFVVKYNTNVFSLPCSRIYICKWVQSD